MNNPGKAGNGLGIRTVSYFLIQRHATFLIAGLVGVLSLLKSLDFGILQRSPSILWAHLTVAAVVLQELSEFNQLTKHAD